MELAYLNSSLGRAQRIKEKGTDTTALKPFVFEIFYAE